MSEFSHENCDISNQNITATGSNNRLFLPENKLNLKLLNFMSKYKKKVANDRNFNYLGNNYFQNICNIKDSKNKLDENKNLDTNENSFIKNIYIDNENYNFKKKTNITNVLNENFQEYKEDNINYNIKNIKISKKLNLNNKESDDFQEYNSNLIVNNKSSMYETFPKNTELKTTDDKNQIENTTQNFSFLHQTKIGLISNSKDIANSELHSYLPSTIGLISDYKQLRNDNFKLKDYIKQDPNNLVKQAKRTVNFNLKKKNDNTKKINDHLNGILKKKYINELDIENPEDNVKDIKYIVKSPLDSLLFKILISLILLIFITSIIVFSFVISAYDRIYHNYLISRFFLLRSVAVSELALLYRNSIIKNKIIYGNYTNSEVNLFKTSLDNYKINFDNTKSFRETNDQEFIYLKNLEINMNKKEMCDYYAYYMCGENSTQINSYNEYVNECKNISGGLNNFGLETSFESMVNLLNNFESDLERIFENKTMEISTSYSEEDRKNFIRLKFSDDSFQRVYKNLNEIFFNINEIIYKKINDFNEYFFDDIGLKHDWVH